MKKLFRVFCLFILVCGVAHAKTHHHRKHKPAAVPEEQPAIPTTDGTVKDPNTPSTPLEFTLTKDKEQLNRELGDLKKTSANAVQIKNERDDFKQQAIQTKRELEQLKVENQALKDSTNQDWFLYGGGLALAGVILGFIIPKISWRRKGPWDSF